MTVSVKTAFSGRSRWFVLRRVGVVSVVSGLWVVRMWVAMPARADICVFSAVFSLPLIGF